MSDQSSKLVEYRPVPGYPAYRVGDDGSVWSRYILGTKTGKTGDWRLMKPAREGGGYLFVALYCDKKRKHFKIHHLVLIAFGFERPTPQHETRHLNDINTDNRLENLKWGTSKENSDDIARNGNAPRGEANPNAKLTDQLVREIRADKGTCKALGLKYGVHAMLISLVKRRKIWKHVS